MDLPTGLRSNGSLEQFPNPFHEPVGFYCATYDGRAFDECFQCGQAMCEDSGDYMEDVDVLPDGCSPHPDPTRITLCEECSVWWTYGELFEDDEEEEY